MRSYIKDRYIAINTTNDICLNHNSNIAVNKDKASEEYYTVTTSNTNEKVRLKWGVANWKNTLFAKQI